LQPEQQGRQRDGEQGASQTRDRDDEERVEPAEHRQHHDQIAAGTDEGLLADRK
jgi:hypothetical protein